MSHSTRGFMLIEMLAALILLTAFALVASRVFSWSMRVIREAPASEERIYARQRLLETLRRDAWSAGEIQATDGSSIRMHFAQQPAIHWRINPDGSIVRSVKSSDGAEIVWTSIGSTLRFEPHDAGALLVVMSTAAQSPDRIALPSELLLLRRMER